MSPSMFTRAAFAAGLLVSGAVATYDAAAKTNIAMYWGQGYDQIPLIDVCTDPNVDIVNIGFINSFPTVRGAYPGSNHANACGSDVYYDPVLKQNSTLYSSCPGIEEAINACHRRGKKVMLSIGGGWPTNYYLKNQDVAEWTAEFLLGAYGKVTPEWKDANKPRPFGSAFVDGFDMDLEAQFYDMPGGDEKFIYANYEHFGNYVQKHSSMLLSAAPQCIVPDARISPIMKLLKFDMIFTQFYNTWECSAAKEVDDKKKGKPSTFTFDKWINEIKNTMNPNAKFYIGLPAGPAGLPTHKEHYVSPEDADYLLDFYKKNPNFGGVMLWEATVSVENPTYGQSFGTWMKKSLDGTFKKDFHPVVSSSTLSSSTATPTSTKLSSSSTPVSSTMVSSSTPISSSAMTSSTPVSSSMVSSSTPTLSTMITSSSASSSSAYATSSSASSSSSVHVSSSSSVAESSSVASSSSSVQESSSVYSEMPTASESASSVATVSSTMIEPSSIATISASASSSESVYVPLPTETITASSVESVSSSMVESSSVPEITATISASSVYETFSTIETVSSTLIEPSSVATISASETASSSFYVPSPSETSASSEVSSSASSSSDMYPTSTVSATTPGASSSSDMYPTDTVSASTPEAASSTPYVPSMEYSMSFSAVYPSEVHSSVVYSSGVYSTASPMYPTDTVSATYPAESSKGSVASSTGHVSTPSVTEKPEYPEYPESSKVPAGSTTSVVTTTYVDVCPTGLTTVTTTYVATVCTKCAKPTGSTDVPEGWTTSVYTASTVTVTITKPIATATHVPAYPSSAPSVAYPADYPAKPVSSGKPAYPAVPEASMPAYPVAPEASKAAEYPAVPEASMPAYPVAPEASKAAEYPSVPEASKGAEYPSMPEASKAAEYPAMPEYPKKPVEQEATSTMYMTLTKVAMSTYTPAPYPTAGGAPYVPAGPAMNGTSMYAPMPTGTGKPAMPSQYMPPAEFEGAASRVGAGFMMLVGVVGAVLLL
ncbi:hypothetical protein J4E86_007400 [Alternaria arbusti]|uniref:uncharacterized protein n=1 Tax=Alternaria arbusti TaxID=232088 RepID=UPI00222069F4|nr:uncharacterized protein J4E86_007400 [Alternaria arbusti]KAI4950892.1 hypothetical protein J4E86_007400 [Alternaria arbusti]